MHNTIDLTIEYKTKLGICYKGFIEHALASKDFEKYKNKINLIFTSPPFPLNRKKKYGNKQGQEYIDWISGLAILFREFLVQDGSIVIELGNSWESRRPVMSTFSLKSLLAFLEKGDYNLCQQFIWNNCAKLPGPAEWVNVKRIRVKDAFTHIWWMSKIDYPKANNGNVLVEYSHSMKKLFKTQDYNFGMRPSEHVIGRKSFLTEHAGAIPSNVITSANTQSNTQYQLYCKEHGIKPHPARMPTTIPKFFIKFLTDPGDLILDPFGGSNTTGEVAEELGRRWVTVEPQTEYIEGSKGRFIKTII